MQKILRKEALQQERLKEENDRELKKVSEENNVVLQNFKEENDRLLKLWVKDRNEIMLQEDLNNEKKRVLNTLEGKKERVLQKRIKEINNESVEETLKEKYIIAMMKMFENESTEMQKVLRDEFARVDNLRMEQQRFRGECDRVLHKLQEENDRSIARLKDSNAALLGQYVSEENDIVLIDALNEIERVQKRLTAETERVLQQLRIDQIENNSSLQPLIEENIKIIRETFTREKERVEGNVEDEKKTMLQNVSDVKWQHECLKQLVDTFKLKCDRGMKTLGEKNDLLIDQWVHEGNETVHK